MEKIARLWFVLFAVSLLFSLISVFSLLTTVVLTIIGLCSIEIIILNLIILLLLAGLSVFSGSKTSTKLIDYILRDSR